MNPKFSLEEILAKADKMGYGDASEKMRAAYDGAYDNYRRENPMPRTPMALLGWMDARRISAYNAASKTLYRAIDDEHRGTR